MKTRKYKNLSMRLGYSRLIYRCSNVYFSGLSDHVKADENNPEKSSKSVSVKVSSPTKTTNFKHKPMIRIARNLYQNQLFSTNSDLQSSNSSVRPNPVLVDEWSKSKVHSSVRPNPVLVEEWSKSMAHCSVQPNSVLVEKLSQSEAHSSRLPNPALVGQRFQSKAHSSVRSNPVIVGQSFQSKAHSSVRSNPVTVGPRFQSKAPFSVRSNPVTVGQRFQSKAHSFVRPNPVLDVECFEPKAPETADEKKVYSLTFRITDEEGNMIFHPRIYN